MEYKPWLAAHPKVASNAGWAGFAGTLLIIFMIHMSLVTSLVVTFIVSAIISWIVPRAVWFFASDGRRALK